MKCSKQGQQRKRPKKPKGTRPHGLQSVMTGAGGGGEGAAMGQDSSSPHINTERAGELPQRSLRKEVFKGWHPTFCPRLKLKNQRKLGVLSGKV